MCLCIISRRQIRETFENTQWRKDKQMQPVWLCMLWAECIEESFENPQWGKSKKCNQCDYASSYGSDLRRHFKIHSGEKSNKCSQYVKCGFVPSHLGAVPPRSGAAVRITRQQLKGVGHLKICLWHAWGLVADYPAMSFFFVCWHIKINQT